MAILRRDRTQPAPSEWTAPTAGPQVAAAPTDRAWHGPTRAIATLVGAAAAGLLAWLTTRIGDHSNGGYWAVYGILAGAGLGMALSQLIGGWTKWGRPRMSPTVFLLAFLPTLIAVGWIVVFHQPHSNTFRAHVVGWSGDLGIRRFVQDMGGDLLSMLSFGLGLVFGFCFDTSGGRVAYAPDAEVVRRPADTEVVRRPADVEPAASEPLARDREVVRS
jgi:hypothetical protein